ncbi:transcriptional repressor NrdR [Candidatus Micrarchaeota archaeon]|nr:transcriptional repressor NrdR [Candidatus Micrarchaeota archaeon]
MKCPYCSFPETRVLDSRETEDLEATRRRRECEKCGKRFTTYERIEEVELIVIKRDGRREKFSREKLKNGIMKACEKRPVGVEKIEGLVDEIEMELRNMNSTEIASSVIGEMVMKRLKRLDEVAYIRFASVYRAFADAESFEKEVQRLKK